MSNNILVLGEILNGKLRNVCFEAAAAARAVAQGGEVIGVLIGESVSNYSTEFIQYGVDRVVIVENKQLAFYTPDGYSQAMMAVIQVGKS